MRVALLATVALLAGCGGGSSDDTQTKLDRLARELVAARVPGTILLFRDGDESSIAAKGVAVRETGKPIQPGERFRIGSVTKTMVAVVVLQLVAERRLGLDDPVERWLAGLVPTGTGVTIRHLLEHTSGFADYVEGRVINDPPEWPPRRVAEYALEQQRLFRRAGSRFAYASTNYILLGLIVENATGSPLGAQLRRRIFGPARLQATTFEPDRISGDHVHGYRASEHGGIVTGHLVDASAYTAAAAWAAGAVVSTAADVARFFSALLGGKLLGPRELLAMRTPRVAPRRYGLGLMVFDAPCGRVYGHTGNINGQITAVWNTKDGSRQVVLAANTYPLSPEADATVFRTLETAFCFL